MAPDLPFIGRGFNSLTSSHRQTGLHTYSSCRRTVDTVDAILGGVELVVNVLRPQGVGTVVQPAGIVVEVEVDGDARRHAGAVRLAYRQCCRYGVESTAV